MGDRVAVLRDGVLQQCDTPLNLYQRAANVFVAGFIGSPAMNLETFRVVDGRARLGPLDFAFAPGPPRPDRPGGSGPGGAGHPARVAGGRRAGRRRFRDDRQRGRGVRVRRLRPLTARHDWIAFIPAAHPGYLILAAFDANQAGLPNAPPRTAPTAKPVPGVRPCP
jgi:hypothetical protein